LLRRKKEGIRPTAKRKWEEPTTTERILFMNKKRIAAVIALVFISLLYLATLILAFIDSPFSRSCLMAALFCTIVIPAILYGYLTLMGHFSDRKQKLEEAGEESCENKF